jgi:hypothetical protein
MFITTSNETLATFFRQWASIFWIKWLKNPFFHQISILICLMITINNPGFSKQSPSALPKYSLTYPGLTSSGIIDTNPLSEVKKKRNDQLIFAEVKNLETKKKRQAQVQVITLQNNASPQEIGELFLKFGKAGIQIDNKINKKRRLNWIKHFNVHFLHTDGLNFKLKVTGFQKLVFEFVYDEQQEFKYFTYRINEEEVYNLIELDIKGFKSYVCYDTGLVVRGETNEDTVRVY